MYVNNDTNTHKKKMIVPIIITVIFLIYLIAYGAIIFIGALEVTPVLLLLALPLLALAGGMVYTLKSRIEEIRSGEEDDLDNY